MIARLPFVFLIFVMMITACSTEIPKAGNTLPAIKPAEEKTTSLSESLQPTGAPTSIQEPIVEQATTEPGTAPASNPVEINVILSEGDAVEGWIPLEGGMLSVKAKDGTVFTLEIPANTLVEPVTVRMTPIAQVEGLPFGAQQTYAVQLEPEGLLFYNDLATLTIEAPAPFPVEEQIFFGYQNAGKDVFLAVPDKNSQAIKITLNHFSGYGVTKGFLADIEPVRERLGGSDETRLQSKIAEAVLRERQRLQNGGSEEDSSLDQEAELIFKEYYEKIVKLRIGAAGESCAAGRLALETAISFVRLLQLMGSEEAFPEIDLTELLEKSSLVCLQEEYQLCAEQHIVHRMVPIWLGFWRESQLLGSSTTDEPSELVKEARRLTENCLTFELVFESTGKTSDGLLGFDGAVSASVPLKFNADEATISGEGALVNEYSNFYAEGCEVNFTPSDGTFETFFLVFETDLEEPRDGNQPVTEKLGNVTAITMEYFPGATQGDLSIVCDDAQIPAGPSSTWFATFLMTHIDEQSTFDGRLTYKANDWDILGGELFAERSWQKSDPSVETTEQGSMKLYHRPGQ